MFAPKKENDKGVPGQMPSFYIYIYTQPDLIEEIRSSCEMKHVALCDMTLKCCVGWHIFVS